MEKIFNAGDKVWVKNLVTNEALEAEVVDVHHMDFEIGPSCDMYTTTEGPRINVYGKTASPSRVFATKEECEASERYYPESGPFYHGNFTDEDWKKLDKVRNGREL